MSANWLSWFQASPRAREREETRDLLLRAQYAERSAELRDKEAILGLATDIVAEVCERHDVAPSVPLADALYWIIHDLLYFDGFMLDLPSADDLDTLTIEEGVRLRAKLRANLHFLGAENRLLPMWREKLVWIFSGMLEYFPPSAFTDIDESGVAADDSVVFPKARALDLCDSLPEVLERLIATLYDQDITDAHVFDEVRERIDENLYRASGVSPRTNGDIAAKLVLPTKSKLKEPAALIDAYLGGTPFQGFFYATLPFAIPFPARFEHTHIIGGTGHGKTQLLQFLIHHDLVRAREDGYTEVMLIGTNERHVKSLAKFIEANLDESEQGKVRYLTSEELVEYLDALGKPQTTEQVVRGYKVKVTHQAMTQNEGADRRAMIAQVIARSMTRNKD